MTRNRNNNVSVSTIEAALVHVFEPLHQLHLMNPTRAQSAESDTGQERTFPTDRGMEITLDMLNNTVHRQLFGVLRNKAGDTFENLKERLMKAEGNMNAHYNNYQGDVAAMAVDPRTYTLDHQIQLAKARYEAMLELHHGLTATIEHFTGKKWTPRPMEGDAQTNGVRNITITDELKAKALETIKRIQAKNQPAAN